jgi:hypothetical protein
MVYTNETLACSAVIFTLLLGFGISFSLGHASDKESSRSPRGSFMERATAPILTDIYRVKNFKRNGKKFHYVMKMDNKNNLNSNKNHPTRTPLDISSKK